MCGPKFCTMRISHYIRGEAQKEGYEKMSKKNIKKKKKYI